MLNQSKMRIEILSLTVRIRCMW